MRNVLLVAIGGAAGATLRYLVGYVVGHRWPVPFPLATLIVNVAGCFAIGIASQAHLMGHLSPSLRLLLMTGVAGSLTTFSTFEYETHRSYLEHGAWLASANVAANVVLGGAALLTGIMIGRLIWGVSESPGL